MFPLGSADPKDELRLQVSFSSASGQIPTKCKLDTEHETRSEQPRLPLLNILVLLLYCAVRICYGPDCRRLAAVTGLLAALVEAYTDFVFASF